MMGIYKLDGEMAPEEIKEFLDYMTPIEEKSEDINDNNAIVLAEDKIISIEN